MNKFAWAEMFSNDLSKSQEFYTKLFGWETKTANTDVFDYTLFLNQGEETAGLIANPEPQYPSAWISNVKSDDVDGAVERARAAGANIIMGPEDIGDQGRFSWVSDPQGAIVVFGQGSFGWQGHSVSQDARHGDVIWHELATSDTAASRDFYTKVLGWTASVEDMGTGPYTVFSDDGTMVGGAMERPPMMPVSLWVVYFRVDDIDAAYARALELGGTSVAEIFHVPTIGRIAWVSDTNGALFAMMETEMPEAS